jgi:hypothetical protein
MRHVLGGVRERGDGVGAGAARRCDEQRAAALLGDARESGAVTAPVSRAVPFETWMLTSSKIVNCA